MVENRKLLTMLKNLGFYRERRETFQQISFKFLPINYPLNAVIEEVNQQLMKHLLIVNLPSMYSTPNLTVCDNEGGVYIWSYLVKGLVFHI